MYIHPFVAGALSVIVAELVCIVVLAVLIRPKKR